LGIRNTSVEHLHDVSTADLKTVQGAHEFPTLPNGQTHHHAHGGNQTGQSNSHAPLTHHLCVHIDRRFVPCLAPGAPAFEQAMVGDLHRGRWETIDHVSGTSQADPTQAQITRWAHRKVMLDTARRHGSAARPIVLGFPLLAGLFLTRFGFAHIRFDKGWRRRFFAFPVLQSGPGQHAAVPAPASRLPAVPDVLFAGGRLLLRRSWFACLREVTSEQFLEQVVKERLQYAVRLALMNVLEEEVTPS
jgi:hypothetical protein